MRMGRHLILIVIVICVLKSSSFAEDHATKNVCVAHSVSDEILELLIGSSMKILSLDPEDFRKELLKAQEITLKISDNITSSVEYQKETLQTVSDVLKSQNRISEILNLVLDNIFSNQNILVNIEDKNVKSLGVILDTLNNINKPEDGTNDILVPLLESILKNLNNKSSCERIETMHQIPTVVVADDDFIGAEKVLNVQNETNSLLKDLIRETKNIQTMKEQMETILNENRELKEQLKKQKRIARPSDCHDLRIAGARKSGVYEIYPDSCKCGPPVRVWCDMETEGGGWTVLIARAEEFNKQENFTRSWLDYETGFGHPEAEYWMGNVNLHLLTSTRKYSLRLEITDRSGRSKWGHWSNFEVASVEQKYKLSISGFYLMSSLDDVLKTHDNQLFSTYDSDNDSSYSRNCARNLKGGWWYGRCYDIHPTGILSATDIRVGVTTASLNYSRRVLVPLTKLSIKIKPKSCVQETTLFQPSKHYCDYFDN